MSPAVRRRRHRRASGRGLYLRAGLFFRGHNRGNRAYFPSHDRQLAVEEVLGRLFGQFYENRPIPPLILLSHRLIEQDLVADVSLRGGRITLARRSVRQEELIDRIAATARDALGRRLAESASTRQLLEGVAAAFGLSGPFEPESRSTTTAISRRPRGRREDRCRARRTDKEVPTANSRIRGRTAAPASTCRPARRTTPMRNRRPGGDDYAMMLLSIARRFGRAVERYPERANGTWPDLVLIDGRARPADGGNAGLRRTRHRGSARFPSQSAKGPDRLPAANGFSCPDRPPSLWSRAIQYCIFCNGYAMRRIASRWARIARSGQRAIARSPLDDSIPGLGLSRSTRCCTISSSR